MNINKLIIIGIASAVMTATPVLAQQPGNSGARGAGGQGHQEFGGQRGSGNDRSMIRMNRRMSQGADRRDGSMTGFDARQGRQDMRRSRKVMDDRSGSGRRMPGRYDRQAQWPQTGRDNVRADAGEGNGRPAGKDEERTRQQRQNLREMAPDERAALKERQQRQQYREDNLTQEQRDRLDDLTPQQRENLRNMTPEQRRHLREQKMGHKDPGDMTPKQRQEMRDRKEHRRDVMGDLTPEERHKLKNMSPQQREEVLKKMKRRDEIIEGLSPRQRAQMEGMNSQQRVEFLKRIEKHEQP